MTINEFTPEYIKTLSGLRESGHTDELICHVKALRSDGWPLSTISEAIGVSKTTISKWSTREASDYPVKVPEYRHPHVLSDFELTNLAILAENASKVRRFTAPQSSARASAMALEVSLLNYRKNGVSITDLARACGVTRRAINQRLEKYDNV